VTHTLGAVDCTQDCGTGGTSWKLLLMTVNAIFSARRVIPGGGPLVRPRRLSLMTQYLFSNCRFDFLPLNCCDPIAELIFEQES
jgi:hypothetical protein